MKEIIKKIGTGIAMFAGVALMATAMFAAPVSAADKNCDPDSGLGGGLACTENDDMPAELTGDSGIVTTVINTMLFIVGILAVIMIIFSGIRYTTAHGDKGQVESAKNTLIYSIVGLVVAIIAYAVVNWVVNLFCD